MERPSALLRRRQTPTPTAAVLVPLATAALLLLLSAGETNAAATTIQGEIEVHMCLLQQCAGARQRQPRGTHAPRPGASPGVRHAAAAQ
jgi:hypothetical protein